MFKCKEQVTKFNPSKLYTLSQIVCLNNNISINKLYHIRYQLPNEPVYIIYNTYCAHLGCDLSEIHDHIGNSNDYKFYNKDCTVYREQLISHILPFNEFSSDTVHEHRRRAVKRRLFD